jgi:hypothetical protein
MLPLLLWKEKRLRKKLVPGPTPAIDPAPASDRRVAVF